MENVLWWQFSDLYDFLMWLFQTSFSHWSLKKHCIRVLFFSQHLPFIWSGVFVWSYLCWFSLSSCCLRRVGRNLLLAKAASMSSISRLLKSRMAERMRRLSSRSTVPSSCDRKRQTCMWLKLSQQSRVANIWLAKISPVALIFASVSKHIADVQLYKNPQLQ